jgi:hypothetical protein
MARLGNLQLSAFVLGVALVAAGCGQSDEIGEGVAVVEGSTPSATTADDGSDGASGSEGGGDRAGSDGEDGEDGAPSGNTDESASSSSRTEGGQQDGTLPGDAFDIGPPAESVLDVVGVRYDDVLNLRERPDPSSPIVDTAAPASTTPKIVSTGEGRLLSRSAWWRVTVGGDEAWANLRFLGMLGATDDAFDELAASIPSTSAPTVEEIIDDIAETRASGPEPTVELVTPIEGLDATGAQVTIDVLGIGDDAVKGERYLLTFGLTFDDPDATDREVVAYELVGALGTVICGRGVTGEACS